MSKFTIGDRVICTEAGSACNGPRVGMKGTVRSLNLGAGVDFDEACGGHDLEGKCVDNHGWWFGGTFDGGIELIEPEDQTYIVCRRHEDGYHAEVSPTSRLPLEEARKTAQHLAQMNIGNTYVVLSPVEGWTIESTLKEISV